MAALRLEEKRIAKKLEKEKDTRSSVRVIKAIERLGINTTLTEKTEKDKPRNDRKQENVKSPSDRNRKDNRNRDDVRS
jgi:hypothetical protein